MIELIRGLVGARWMVGRTRVLGASLVAVGLSVGVAQAKTVRYEINGQRYSYSTEDREQAALAQQRIRAANAEAAARAKAEAERAANPFVRLFGSVHDRLYAQRRRSQRRARPGRRADREAVHDRGVGRQGAGGAGRASGGCDWPG